MNHRTIQNVVNLYGRMGYLPIWRGNHTVKQQGFLVYHDMKRYLDQPEYWLAGLFHPLGRMLDDSSRRVQEMKASRWLMYHNFPDSIYRSILFQEEARMYRSGYMKKDEEDMFFSLPDAQEILMLHDCIKRCETSKVPDNLSWKEPIQDMTYVLEK